MSYLEQLKREYALADDYDKINHEKLMQITIINNMVSLYGMKYVEKLKTFNEQINKPVCNKVYSDSQYKYVEDEMDNVIEFKLD